ncbi:O-acyltransferase like protein [Tribolium castaneum]|uniref:Nose resistant to fluoxetine protein 6-like Protein n=1 Tax=Tribolium castaneum TaxID=7070 RepID=D6WLW1_TRICA|nr:PREDICTED: uncharacterized protein LOC663251 [Tribolium castaneum]EFA04173.1 Nose resistant to fluoxetine protein 6-like Protein [Tribolium castaneum]|eukprot:XP_974400.1 PREDICTED: uncharacterized protein LOC663251 [Tribolium castaneum]
MQKVLLFLVAGVLAAHAKFHWNRTSFPRVPVWNFTIEEKTLLNAEQTGKLCLKNVDKCMEEDFNYETTANRLADFVFGIVPPFDLSQVEGVAEDCKRQSEKYVEELLKFKLWALKMYDASAKLPTGILNGNVNQLGDFDLCLQANERRLGIRGKYCLASMQVEAGAASPYILALHRLAQSHHHFRSQLDDPGHRVPRFSSVNWALCVPSACSSADVQLALRTKINTISKNTDLAVRVLVEPDMCQSSQKEPLPTSTIIVSGIFAGIVLLVAVSTGYDCYALGEKNRWMVAFSLRKNWTTLVTIKRSSDDIEAIHGIRFLNAFLLVLAHKSMAMFFTPYMNRTEMIEFVSRPWTVIGRAASLYTDPFILISGTLTAYSLLGKLKKNGRISVREEYISRLFRILPTFAALIAFCTFVLPWMNQGPMWNQVVTHHSDLCKQYWWRNLLFIHNYFGFKDMCLTHTHHVGIDTQLFFVSPLFALLLWKWPKRGVYVLAVLALASTAWRYYVTYTMKLSNYIHFGTSITQLFATADNMYIIPLHRATVYIMGVLLGYILRNYRNISLSKSQLRFGNTVALLSFIASLFGPAFMGSIDYVYNPTDAAWYAAFAPILWCFSFGWIIFTSHLGYKGLVERFFSWPPFSLWTKISYTVYLTQFPVFFYNVGITRTTQHYGFFKILLNLQELAWVWFLSVVLTLLIEMPFQNIRNIVFKKERTPEPLHKKIS